MNLKTLFQLIKERKLFLMLKAGRSFGSFYRISYASAAASSGFLKIFANGPLTLEDIQTEYAENAETKDIVRSWLYLGIKLKEIKLSGEKFRLSGICKYLSQQGFDAYHAMVQEVAEIHHKLILKAPEIMKTNKKWDFTEHDGSLVARSSRTVEPFVLEAIESLYPETGEVRLLGIGCGSGIYLKHAAMLNKDLKAVGLELQKDVYDMAVKNISRWGINDRVSITFDDIRDFSPEEKFDIVSLHNNIYYFEVEERIELLKKIYTLLNSNGQLVITTCSHRGSSVVEMLNLWCLTTEGYGRLPSEWELKNQLKDAGFSDVRTKQLIPGEQYCAFVGYKDKRG